MNIIITLPTKLANLIYEGEKTIEVRKTWPKQFDPKNDVVYICEKGTGLVTGMFTIDAKGISKSPAFIWKEYKQQICIDDKWFFNYLQNTKKFYLWHIMQADRFIKPYSLKDVFGVKSAPQSYIYTDIGWFLNDNFNIEVETSEQKAVQ